MGFSFKLLPGSGRSCCHVDGPSLRGGFECRLSTSQVSCRHMTSQVDTAPSLCIAAFQRLRSVTISGSVCKEHAASCGSLASWARYQDACKRLIAIATRSQAGCVPSNFKGRGCAARMSRRRFVPLTWKTLSVPALGFTMFLAWRPKWIAALAGLI